ncbi:MAG: Mur ligase family protein [bacterium]|nr:Mur ligase family protein [bacterium]
MKHIHFIGICGIAMGSLALAFKRADWKVTGSDVGFYPPMSTFLKESGVEYYPGWHPEKMGVPDLVVIGNVAGSANPEWLYVQKNKIKYLSYPEAVAQYFIKRNSIVCAGTYGKTTTTSLLSFVMAEAGFDPSYMFGGLMANNSVSAKITASDWSVMEGDEYRTSREDNRAKFFSYQPTHLLLTAVAWDHADVYPTEELYVNAFHELVKMIPTNGLIVVSENVAHVILENTKIRLVQYGKNSEVDYYYQNIFQTKDGITFEIVHQQNKYPITCPMIGEYNAENICGAFAMAREIGISPEKIISAITKFPGIKRRLQKRGQINGADVYDDIAHSPIKVNPVLKSLREIYTGKIIAIFEPNTGNRQAESIPQYTQAFADADIVIIPRLTKIKIDNSQIEQPLEGDSLTEIIISTHKQVMYIEDDTKLINYLKQKTTANDAVVFLGSHGFRGMIDELVK